MIGIHLGPYEIVAKLGAGGMGEVWRARDPKLERDVAIKLLPDDLAADPERIARFEREAKLLAQLNHNNIATIFGLEEDGGRHFIVMELVDGVSLADRMAGRSAAGAEPGAGLAAGRIAIDDALQIARQIAEALEAAHAHGVIHRDLKPANIMVTESGAVKVLDFGLAKAYQADGSGSGIGAEISPDISNSPTIVNATRSGVIMGTAAYMSPEQASGTAVDKRTDIWAFGVVLFEMLSGQRLFAGETAAHVMADVLKTEPDLSRLDHATPLPIRRLLRRCLRKKPHDRLHDIADARLVIDEVVAGTEDEGVAGPGGVPPAAPATGFSLVHGAALAIVLVAGIAGGRWYAGSSVASPPPVRVFDIDSGLESVRWVALSPDGDTLVIVARAAEGEANLYVRRMEDPALVPLADTERASQPFFSPGSDWIGFWAPGASGGRSRRLRKASLEGAVVDIHEFDERASGGSWAADDTIVFESYDGVSQIPSSGGLPTVVVVETESTRPSAPQRLPSGRVLLQVSGSDGGGFHTDVAVYSPDDDTIEVLVEDADTPRFVPPGHLFYGRAGSVWMVGYDAAADSIIEPARLVTQGVQARSSFTRYSVADDGTLAFIPGEFRRTVFSNPESRVVLVDRQGNETALPITATDLQSVRLSPDGNRLAAFRWIDGQSSIHVYDMNTGAEQRLPAARDNNGWPQWSTNGEWVYFVASDEDGPVGIYRARPGFPGVAPEFVNTGDLLDVSPDGSVLYTERGGVDLALISVGGEPQELLESEDEVLTAQFSPDGRFVAYATSDGRADGALNVFVRDLETHETIPVSPNGGAGPIWSEDGTGLIYVAGVVRMSLIGDRGSFRLSGLGDLELMRVPVTAIDGSFRPAAPEPFFDEALEARPPLSSIRGGMDILADGRLVYTTVDTFAAFADAPAPTTVRVVLNWLANFERPAAAGGSR